MWLRTLRQAVISASDRPGRARPWIFAVENEDVMMEDLTCADDGRHRTLDVKLAEALTKILKGEPSRKTALAAERAALSQEVSSGRQCLLPICQEFRRTEAKTNAWAIRTSRTSAAVQVTARWNPFSRCGRTLC